MWRPLGHMLFAAPREEKAAWILDAPGHREDGNPVPEKFFETICKKGTIELPAGVFDVAQEFLAGDPEATWLLDAPGHQEDGRPVPENHVGQIVVSERRGSLMLGAGCFTVIRPTVSSSSTRRRVSFNTEAEVHQVPPNPEEPTWVFDAPGFAEHGRPVPMDYVQSIVRTGTLPRVALPGGFFTVAFQPVHQEDVPKAPPCPTTPNLTSKKGATARALSRLRAALPRAADGSGVEGADVAEVLAEETITEGAEAAEAKLTGESNAEGDAAPTECDGLSGTEDDKKGAATPGKDAVEVAPAIEMLRRCFAAQAADFVADVPQGWVLVAPGRPQDGELVPPKYIPNVVSDANMGRLELPGGAFTVVLQAPFKSQPRPAYKTAGARLPRARTNSEDPEPRACSNVACRRTCSAPPLAPRDARARIAKLTLLSAAAAGEAV